MFVLVFPSCKSDTVEPSGPHSISGRTTITSTTGYGFSFARGTPQPTPPFPQIDSVDDFDAGHVLTTPDGPEPIGLCFSGYTSNMFHLVGNFSTLDSARAFFLELSEITDTSFIQNTCGGIQGFGDPGPVVAARQIWSVQTRENRYAKMLILQDTVGTVTFDWVYQPTGSRRF
jgi:hypothetical protein